MGMPIANARIYGDFAGLEALKKAANAHDPGALREVAQAFESLFARMLIKSMRDAIGPDPIFGSDQEQAYQQMYDDQLSMELTQGRGLGLADMLVRELQARGGAKAAAPAQASGQAQAAGQATAAHPPSIADRQAFVHTLWPEACQAARQLGVAPQSLVAQAALETGWGCAVPSNPDGRSSHNLFGMKTAAGWQGPSVTAATHEVAGGIARPTVAQFRAYGSDSESFADYVALLKDDPRYAAALGTGPDSEAFASALQRGGYATDPDYARKIAAIAQEVAGIAAGTRGPLKLASAAPISNRVTPAS